MSNIRAGAAYVELMLKSGAFNKGLNAAGDRLRSFGRGVGLIGGIMAGVGATVAAPLVSMAVGFGAAGAAVDDMSQRTGLTAEQVGRLGYAAQMSGSDAETLESGITKMNKVMAAGSEIITDLGLSHESLQGMNQNDRFLAFANAISKIKDPAKQAALSMDVFGKAGAKLLPMFADGAAGIIALGDEAERLNLVISTDDAKNAAALDDALDKVKKTIAGVSLTIGAALAPALTMAAETMANVISTATGWATKNRDLIRTVFMIAGGVIAAGAAIATLGAGIIAVGAVLGGLSAIMTAAGAAVGMLGAIFAAIVSPIGLVIAAIVGLGGYLVYTSGIGQTVLEKLSSVFGEVKDEAIGAFGAIGKALAAGDIAAAGAVLWALLKMQWVRGVSFIENIWFGFTDAILGAWADVTYGLSSLIVDGVSGIQRAWIETVDFLADAWAAFSSSVRASWNATTGFLQKAWVRLKGLIDSDINVDAEVAAIDANTDMKNRAGDDERDKAVMERERRRRQTADEINTQRAAMKAELNRMKTGEAEARKKRRGDRIADAQREIDDAKSQLQKQVDAANNMPPKAAAEAGAAPAAPADYEFELPELELSSEATKSIDGFGSEFKADVLGGFGGGGFAYGQTARVNDFKAVAGTAVAGAGNASAPLNAINRNNGGGMFPEEIKKAILKMASNSEELTRLAARSKLVFA